MKKVLKKKTIPSNDVLKIICDTREQNPFEWDTDVQLYNDTLPCGDYTLVGHDLPTDDFSVIIERKASCQELITNLAKKWDAFENELALLQKYHTKCIVVCEPSCFPLLYHNKWTKLHPNFVESRLLYIYVRYQIPTIFFSNSTTARNYVHNLFKKVKRVCNDSEC